MTTSNPIQNNQPPVNDQAGNRQPIATVDHFPLRAAIWENLTKEGEVFHSVTFERSYKKDGQWRSSQNFNRSDLLGLAKLADATETEIRRVLEAHYSRQQTTGEVA